MIFGVSKWRHSFAPKTYGTL